MRGRVRLRSADEFKAQMVVCVVLAFALAVALAPSSAIGAAPAAQKPNVLFIAIDDLNDWVGCLGGHPQAQTPNIDRLAACGTLFRNAHCQAPLCNPSRASLLTGLRPSTTGIYGLVPGIREVARTRKCVTLPQYFARHGYFTAAFGKVFHDLSIPEELQTNEFNVWGPAAAHAAAQGEACSHSLAHTGHGLGCVSQGRPRPGRLEDCRCRHRADEVVAAEPAFLPRRRVPPATRALLCLAEVVRPIPPEDQIILPAGEGGRPR